MTATVFDQVRPSHLLFFFIPILSIYEMVVEGREKEMDGLYQVPLVYPQLYSPLRGALSKLESSLKKDSKSAFPASFLLACAEEAKRLPRNLVTPSEMLLVCLSPTLKATFFFTL